MLIWLEDAPKIKDGSTENDADVCKFVDHIIACEREWNGSPHTYQTESTEESWKDIVRRQTHKHTATCKRKRGDQTVCRFNIPFLPMDVTRILRPFNNEEEQIITDQEFADFHDGYKRIRQYLDANADTLVDSAMTFEAFLEAIEMDIGQYVYSIRSTLKTTKLFIRRTPNQVLTNGYNRKILSMFRSNMDLQYIVDAYACCSYVADYINKADKGISRTLREMYARHRSDPSSDAFETLRSIATTYYNSAEISAQEAAYDLLRLRMSEASTACVFIPTAVPQKRVHIIRKEDDLLAMNGESTDCIHPGLIEHYVNRPDVFERLNLAQFAAYFNFSLKRPGRGSDANAEEAAEEIAVEHADENTKNISQRNEEDNEEEDNEEEDNEEDNEEDYDKNSDNVIQTAFSDIPVVSKNFRAGIQRMWMTRRKSTKLRQNTLILY